jgi:hypothetical protein
MISGSGLLEVKRGAKTQQLIYILLQGYSRIGIVVRGRDGARIGLGEFVADSQLIIPWHAA